MPLLRSPRVLSILALLLSLNACGFGLPDSDTSDAGAVLPTGQSVAVSGEGFAPYDLCGFDAPVTGAVSFDDVRGAGVQGFDDEFMATGGSPYLDAYSFLSSGVRCLWFLKDGTFSLRMDPGDWYFDLKSDEPDAVQTERNGWSVVTAGEEITVLFPSQGYGGWTTFSVGYDARETQPAPEQAAVREQLLDLFLDKVTFAPPVEPELGTPEWFECSRPGAVGSSALNFSGVANAMNKVLAEEWLSIDYSDGAMSCSVNGVEGWSASVSFVWDEEARSSLEAGLAPVEVGRSESVAGFDVAVAPVDPDRSTPRTSIDIVLPEGRLRVSTYVDSLQSTEAQNAVEQSALDIAAGVLAGRTSP